jgi:mRNA interferase RelE/StbE
MAFIIELKPAAVRDLKRLPRRDQQRVASRIDALAEDPRPPGVEKLAGSRKDLYRVRAGDYRIIYEVRRNLLLVLVVRIRHRRDVYRSL